MSSLEEPPSFSAADVPLEPLFEASFELSSSFIDTVQTSVPFDSQMHTGSSSTLQDLKTQFDDLMASFPPSTPPSLQQTDSNTPSNSRPPFEDDLSLSVDTLEMRHPQRHGIVLFTTDGIKLSPLFSLTDLEINGQDLYTSNGSLVKRISENQVLIGNKELVNISAELQLRTALQKGMGPRVVLHNCLELTLATDEFSTSAEEVAEKLTQSRFIHGIPFIQEGKSHGHVVFALSDLPPGINWFHPIHDVYILPHSDGKTFTINGKVYDSAVQSVDGKFDAELRNFSALKHGLVS